MSGNNGLTGLCKAVEGGFNHNFDVLNNPIFVDPISIYLPEYYPSPLQTYFPHAYVILRAVDPDNKWSFTPNALEDLFGGSEIMEYSQLKDLFVGWHFLQEDIGKEFILKLRNQFFERFGDSLSGQVIRYLTQVNEDSVEMLSTVVVGDRYLVTRNHKMGLDVYNI